MDNERNIYRVEGTAALKVEKQQSRPEASIISFQPKRAQSLAAHTDSSHGHARMADCARFNAASETALRTSSKRNRLSVSDQAIYIRGFFATSLFALVLILIGA